MIAVFTHPMFNCILERLTMRNTAQILMDWRKINQQKEALKNAMSQYGRGTTIAMSNCLVDINLDHTTLKQMQQTCSSKEEFCDQLRKSGVKMKIWREKLWEHFSHLK